ncbi:MFS transporter [Delftia acidovorans]|uniref:MFS transporter n=1 Tax=Delftia acidovorans TaxID=80866 RepID=A0AAJ2V9R4_DELAC|nr:MFS transporter [Delftia acidovorans]MDX4953627.1 MFS transporter [Delftia acidovorans]
MLKNSMHRQVLILSCAQALFQIVSVGVMTVGGLAGAAIAESPRWATLPIATMFLGTATMMFPASMWMARVGRRLGFQCGTLLGIAGGLTAAWGISAGSLALLAFGTFLIGNYQAFAQFYRFAASEVADEGFRPRAISFVMAGGVVAALAGPMLARLGGPLLQPEYLGSFLIMAVVSFIATGVLLGFHVPAKATGSTQAIGKGRPWQEIVLQPAYLVALFGASTGYGIMILAMTATPIAMVHHHHALGTAATVIQLHVLGMFLPSFFTGSLIARFGVLRIMFTGVVLFLGHILMTMTGTGFNSFASALVLLGVGWNFLYIGGTTLLTSTYAPAEKARAQAINDMTIFAVGLVCSFSAGGLLEALGWQRMNVLLLPWLVLAALSLGWFGLKQKAPLKQEKVR